MEANRRTISNMAATLAAEFIHEAQRLHMLTSTNIKKEITNENAATLNAKSIGD